MTYECYLHYHHSLAADPVPGMLVQCFQQFIRE